MGDIFLSYAKEDKPTVDTIFLELKQAGLNPWMDKPPHPYELLGIKPGEDWDQVIRIKLKQALLVLVFLSKVSVEKAGYVQKEYRLALSLASQQPSERIYLIPVKINECNAPSYIVDTASLEKLQWFLLYEDGIEKFALVIGEIYRTLTGLPVFDSSSPEFGESVPTKLNTDSQYRNSPYSIGVKGESFTAETPSASPSTKAGTEVSVPEEYEDLNPASITLQQIILDQMDRFSAAESPSLETQVALLKDRVALLQRSLSAARSERDQARYEVIRLRNQLQECLSQLERDIETQEPHIVA